MAARIIVACKNQNNSPDFVFVKVKATIKSPTKAAIAYAKVHGFAGPFIAFDADLDTAGIAIAKVFVWKSATTIIVG